VEPPVLDTQMGQAALVEGVPGFQVGLQTLVLQIQAAAVAVTLMCPPALLAQAALASSFSNTKSLLPLQSSPLNQRRSG
jgi:hypothetical protein